jgi:hypothetical protein
MILPANPTWHAATTPMNCHVRVRPHRRAPHRRIGESHVCRCVDPVGMGEEPEHEMHRLPGSSSGERGNAVDQFVQQETEAVHVAPDGGPRPRLGACRAQARAGIPTLSSSHR